MTDNTKPRLSLRLRALLYTSVAFNLLILGIATGIGFTFHKAPGPEAGGKPDRGGSYYTRALSDDQRRGLRDHLRDRFDAEQGPSDRRVKGRDQIFLDIASAMKAEPFDAQVVSDLFDEQTRQNADRLEKGQIALRDFLLQLDPAERVAFADRLERDILKRANRSDEGPRK